MASFKPLISVVMPTHNRVSFLPETIESIRKQLYKNWELIIVDDASTDSTKDLVEYYQSIDSRIRYFKFKKHQGIAKARNKGNNLAEGKVIVVQDSDDISDANRLVTISRLYLKKKFDIGYSDWFVCDDKLMVRERRAAMPFNFEKLKQAQYIASPTLFYSKKLAMEIPYRPYLKVGDDWQFLIDCAFKKKNFVRINKPLVKYRMHMGCTSITHMDEVNAYDNKMKEKQWLE